MTTSSTTTVQNRLQRSNSYDSAYYNTMNNNSHITFVTHRQSELNNNSHISKYSNSLHRQQNDDNITLVADEEDDSRSYKVIASSISSYLSETYSKYSPSIVLENKGNTARDHLANERTYLAWFRTSISLITLGIGIIQVYHVSMAHHKRFGRVLGLIFVMTSILFLYFGNVRYFHAQWALQHGNFPASRGVVSWASFCILVLFTGMLTVMMLEAIEKTI